MTDVTFVFNAQTRSLKRGERKYAGQALDSISTTIQLYFIRNDVDLDGRDVAQLSATEYILSAISSVSLKSSIKCRPGCNPCYPSSPQTEPGVMGYINLFKDYALLSPVKAKLNEDIDRIQLEFKTYMGRADCRVPLNVPYLDSDGRIPAKFLDIITKWYGDDGTFLPTHENLPSALLTYNALMEKTDKSMSIAPWDPVLEYSIGSTVIASDGRIYRSISDGNIGLDPIENAPTYWIQILERMDVVTEWNDPPLDEFIPSEALVKETLDTKTDKTMAVPWWDGETEYHSGSVVVFEWNLYISRADGNIGHNPEEDDTWWTPIRGSGEGAEGATVTRIVGNGEDTEFIIRHGYDSYDFFYEIRYTESHRKYTDADVSAPDPDHLKVSFVIPPEPNQFTVMVAPSVVPTNNMGFVGVLGNGIDTEFDVTHNLGRYNFFSAVRLNDEERTYTDAEIRATSLNTAKVIFAEPPPVNGVTVMMARAFNSADTGEWTYEQFEPSDEWVIKHPLDRIVSVYVTDSEGHTFIPDVYQDLDTLDTVTVKLNRPLTGIAVLR